MGDHHNHNNHRHSTGNHNNSHSNRHSHQHQNNPHQNQNHRPRPPQGMSQYERPVGPTKPSRFDNLKQRFQNRFTEKTPTPEEIARLKVRAEHARYSADVKVHKAREAKAERENPSGWRRLFAATQQQKPTGRTGRVGTRRPRPSQYYGGQGRGPPQMGDSMLIGPGSFSGDSLMFSPEGGHVGDNMLSFQGNGRNFENDMLTFHGDTNSFGNGGKQVKSKKSEPSGIGFGEGAISMFKF